METTVFQLVRRSLRLESAGLSALKLIGSVLRRALFICNRYISRRTHTNARIAPSASDRDVVERLLVAVQSQNEEGQAYLKEHLDRMVDTLLVTPASRWSGRTLELVF